MATRAAPAAPASDRPRLRVVASEGDKGAAKRRSMSPIPVVLLVILAVFGVAVIQAWVGQDGLRAAALEREVQVEQERLTLLRARLAQLSSPARLKEEAAEMGLVTAQDPRFLRVQVPAEGSGGDTEAGSPVETKKLAAPTP